MVRRVGKVLIEPDMKAKYRFGDHFLELKLRHKDPDWRNGCEFDSREPVENISDLSEMKKIITTHPQSPFNKKPSLTRVTSMEAWCRRKPVLPSGWMMGRRKWK